MLRSGRIEPFSISDGGFQYHLRGGRRLPNCRVNIPYSFFPTSFSSFRMLKLKGVPLPRIPTAKTFKMHVDSPTGLSMTPPPVVTDGIRDKLFRLYLSLRGFS